MRKILSLILLAAMVSTAAYSAPHPRLLNFIKEKQWEDVRIFLIENPSQICELLNGQLSTIPWNQREIWQLILDYRNPEQVGIYHEPSAPPFYPEPSAPPPEPEEELSEDGFSLEQINDFIGLTDGMSPETFDELFPDCRIRENLEPVEREQNQDDAGPRNCDLGLGIASKATVLAMFLLSIYGGYSYY